MNNEKYGAAVDMWALGVITYMLLCGFPPFFDTNIKNMFYQIKKARFHFPSPFWDTISEQAKDLIRKLLVVDARKRYTAVQLLKHPWITGEFFDESEEILIDDVPLPPELPPTPIVEPMETKINDYDAGILSDNEDLYGSGDNKNVDPPTPEPKENKEPELKKHTPIISPVISPPVSMTYGTNPTTGGVLSPVVSTPNSMADIGSTVGSDGTHKSEQGSVVLHPTPSPRQVGGNEYRLQQTGNKDGVIGTPITVSNDVMIDIPNENKAGSPIDDLRIDANAEKATSPLSDRSSTTDGSPKKKSSGNYLQSPESQLGDQDDERLMMKRTRSDPLKALQTPPVPFHVDSELFPDSENMMNLELNPVNDEKEQTETKSPRFRKTQTLDRVAIENAKRKHGKKSGKNGKRPRVDTRGNTNVAYMVDGTIFQIQKQQINKLKMEIQKEQQNLEKLSNQLQHERQQFLLERQQFEQEKDEWERQKEKWLNEHEHLKQLKFELNDVVNKFLTFNHPK